jgi:hypothetical protein
VGACCAQGTSQEVVSDISALGVCDACVVEDQRGVASVAREVHDVRPRVVETRDQVFWCSGGAVFNLNEVAVQRAAHRLVDIADLDIDAQEALGVAGVWIRGELEDPQLL